MIGGRELKPSIVKGYAAIQPVVNGTRRTAYLHRAIAILFVHNPDGKPHVNHVDGNKSNNSIDNLEWCTHKENMAHAFRTGLASAPDVGPGEKSPAAKLRDADVLTIKRRLSAGDRIKQIAADYGVSYGAIWFISRGETWSHIQP